MGIRLQGGSGIGRERHTTSLPRRRAKQHMPTAQNARGQRIVNTCRRNVSVLGIRRMMAGPPNCGVGIVCLCLGQAENLGCGVTMILLGLKTSEAQPVPLLTGKGTGSTGGAAGPLNCEALHS